MGEGDFLYDRIYRELAEDIEAGKRAPGDRLPTEQELAALYGVSRITSKRALNMLAERGLAVRRRGLGSFVRREEPAAPQQAANGRASFTLRSQSLRRVALIMEDLGESYSLGLFYEIDRQARALGMQVCVELSYGDQANERGAIHRLLAMKPDGLLIMPAHGRYYNTDLLRLVLDHFPVAVIDRPLYGIPAPCIYTDNRAAGDLLCTHLIEQGCRSIAYVTADMSEAVSLEERYLGYEQAMLRAGLESARPVILPRIARFEHSSEASVLQRHEEEAFLTDWLRQNPGVEAIIGSEYGIAHLARLAAEAECRRVPEDLCIACFDAKYGYLGEYGYTHIKQDEAAIAASALEVLTGMMEGKNLRRQTRLIPARLMVGESTLRTK